MWLVSGANEANQLVSDVNVVKTEVLNMSEVDSVISDIEVSTSAEHAVNDSYDGDNDDDDNNNDVVAPSDDQDQDRNEDRPPGGTGGQRGGGVQAAVGPGVEGGNPHPQRLPAPQPAHVLPEITQV